MRAEPKTVMKVLWTRAYRPFIMGGDVHASIGTELECTEVDLGKGFKGLIAVCPDGTTIVAEYNTGAIVGRTLEQVRLDIEEGELAVMQQQVYDATIMQRKVVSISAEQFWKTYAGGAHQYTGVEEQEE